jgi:hypothetical protein
MDRPIVSCEFLGQLGNQLFIIAATSSYAWDYNAIALFPGLHDPKNHISLHRDKLFFRMDSSSSPRPFMREFWEKYWFSPDKIPYCNEDLFLHGYFQSWIHFHHHRNKLLSLFAPHPTGVDYLYAKYGELLCSPNTVSIHVRTNCRRMHESLPFLGIEYIKNAMSVFPADSKFVVFSDRINWCKKHVSKLPGDFIFIEGNDEVEDLILMSMMKHHIIANSTFSWWSAYLNQNPNKKIVAPSITSIGASTEYLYFPEWIVIPVTIEPYPDDMCLYDAKSQSLDNND